MLIVVVMGSLYAVTSQLEVTTRKYARDESTLKALALAKEALIGYAATYRDDPAHPTEVFGYLPCPDTSIGDGTALPNCGTAGNAAVGLLPYKTLGLPDLRDSDGVCLWYAVSGTFKNNPKASSTVMNWDTQGQFSIGTSVVPDQGDGGAIAVVFAAGLPLPGQSRTTSGSYPCQIDPSHVSAYLDGNYNFATSAVIPITLGTSGSTSNNDQLAWITPREIFDKVVKRQDFSNPSTATTPGQINKLTDEIKAVLEKNIQDDLAAGTTTLSQPVTADFTQFGKQIGKLPAAMTLNDATNYANYYTNWSEQYRQVMCASLGVPCLNVAGTTCRGALMFGGRTANGQPRPGAQKLVSPLPLGTTNLGYYFESPTAAPPVPGGGLDILMSSNIFSGSTAYSAASPSADFGACLFPGDFVSLGQDVGSFSRVYTSAVTPEAVINVVAKTVTLGNPAATASGRGCVWYPNPLAFNSSLRAYYKVSIANFGEGFMFAVLDAPNNQAAMTGGTLCGTTTGALMGYSSASVAAPKFGLEIDTVSTTTANCTGSNRNDPSSADHMAFVYWGAAATTTDDNCHGSTAGTLGSGSQPLNPRTLTPSTATVQSASWSGNVATLTTAAAHGLASNQQVTIAGIKPSLYNGNVQVAVIDATHLAYALQPGPVASISWSGNVATIATSKAHGLATGNPVTISGVTPAGYNGTFTVASVADATHFTVPLLADPGTVAAVTSASCAANLVTLATSVAHGLAAYNQVLIAGITPAGYNGAQTVASVIDATHFTYVVAACPAAYTSGGTLVSGGGSIYSSGGTVSTVAGIKNVQVSDASLPYAGILPLNTPIHVRLDVNKSFDATPIQAASWSANTVTVTTPSAHGLLTNQRVTISGSNPAGYDGTYTVGVTDSTHFTYALGANPGSYSAGGQIRPPTGVTVQTASASASGVLGAYTATIATAAAHGFVSGQPVTIANVLPAAYNGTYRIVVVDPTHFTYALGANPGAYTSGGSLTAAVALTLKTYVASNFPNCALADFQNLSRDLSSFCAQTPSVEQSNVYMNVDAATGKALSTIFSGFTNAQSSASSSEQTVTISDYIIKTQ